MCWWSKGVVSFLPLHTQCEHKMALQSQEVWCSLIRLGTVQQWRWFVKMVILTCVPTLINSSQYSAVFIFGFFMGMKQQEHNKQCCHTPLERRATLLYLFSVISLLCSVYVWPSWETDPSSAALPRVSSIVLFWLCFLYIIFQGVFSYSNRGSRDRGCRSLYRSWSPPRKCECDSELYQPNGHVSVIMWYWLSLISLLRYEDTETTYWPNRHRGWISQSSGLLVHSCLHWKHTCLEVLYKNNRCALFHIVSWPREH